jgi:hypothetical protein
MAKFQRVYVRFWQDPKVRGWADHQKLLGAYLLTCPHRTSEGLFWLPHGYVAQDLGWSIERVWEGYSGLEEAGFCVYDDTSETVLLCKALKYEAPAGPKQIQGAITRLAEVPPSPLFAQLRDAAEKYAPDFCKALDEALESGILHHHRYPTDTPPGGYPSRARGVSVSDSVSDSKTKPSPTDRASRAVAAPASITPIPTAQTFVAAYVDGYRGRTGHDPPSRVKGQIAKELGRLFAEGIPAEHIKAGLLEWFDRAAHPATLPSFVEVAGRGGRPRASPSKSTARLVEEDRRLARWAEQMEGGNGDATSRVAPAGRQDRGELPRPGSPG